MACEHVTHCAGDGVGRCVSSVLFILAPFNLSIIWRPPEDVLYHKEDLRR